MVEDFPTISPKIQIILHLRHFCKPPRKTKFLNCHGILRWKWMSALKKIKQINFVEDSCYSLI